MAQDTAPDQRTAQAPARPAIARNRARQLRRWSEADLQRQAAIVPAKLEPLALAVVGPKLRDLLKARRDTRRAE